MRCPAKFRAQSRSWVPRLDLQAVFPDAPAFVAWVDFRIAASSHHRCPHHHAPRNLRAPHHCGTTARLQSRSFFFSGRACPPRRTGCHGLSCKPCSYPIPTHPNAGSPPRIPPRFCVFRAPSTLAFLLFEPRRQMRRPATALTASLHALRQLRGSTPPSFNPSRCFTHRAL
jgi:hypothetical protein